MKNYFLFLTYILLSLLIGEAHPFSEFPMYNHFPNYTYVFYVSDEKNEVIPYLKKFNFSKNAGFIAHKFYSICDYNNYFYGFNKENPLHLNKVGKELMEFILEGENTTSFDFDTLKLYKRYYFIQNNQIQYEDQLMCAKSIHP